MTAKEYLNQARHLDALINCRLREIDYWRNLSSSVSCMKFDGMPHSPNRPTEAPFVRCLEKIDEIQRDVEKKVAYLVRLKEEITAAIESFDFSGFPEVTFCGYGEPLCAFDNLVMAGKLIKRKYPDIKLTAWETSSTKKIPCRHSPSSPTLFR